MPQQPMNQQARTQTDALMEQATQETTTAHRPWYQLSKVGRMCLGTYTILLALFGALAWLCWLLETSVPKKSANDGSTGSFSLQFMHQ